MSTLNETHAKVRDRIIQKRQHEIRRRKATECFNQLEIGDRVWIFYPKKRKGTAKKFVGERFRGPYEVCKLIGDTSYQVKPLGGGGKSKIVNHR